MAEQITELDENGLAVDAGWITVYHADHVTREYTCKSEEFLMRGTGIPADSYTDVPSSAVAGQAVCRRADGGAWETVADYRGQTAYRIADGKPQAVTALGELPDGLTLLAPLTVFDKWNGEVWVTDVAAQHAAEVVAAQQEQAARKATATARITELSYAVELGIATDVEQAAMTEWKTYMVQLSRLDASAAPDIDWPAAPEK
ncbi:tail fiber assembly protein [Dickeya undicola]|uniref:Tail fiber assembly protein n=1 Tax=Dickeya undicola TaxID=1577887 RepID=A0ABX9WXG0_9GAMM|nr:tail fiber assembly protein [Dickeya undicola]RNM26760.1 tail fiber assembly protein [Dickeya undicola]